MFDKNAIRSHLPNRRDALATGLKGGLTLTGLGLVAGPLLAVDPTPGTTEGPYWVDELLNRSDIRSDPSTGTYALGFPLRMTINVSQLSAEGIPTPLPNTVIDIWHCNALGVYSDVSAQNTVGMKFLRGYQITDMRGNVRFTTIYPGWYSGRTPHIHVRARVYDPATDAVIYDQVSQFFFDDSVSNQVYQMAPYNQHPGRDTLNSTDTIYMTDSDDDDIVDGQELLLNLSAKSGYVLATYNFSIDLADGNGNGDDQGDIGGGGPPPGGVPPDGTPPPGGGGPPGGVAPPV